MPGPRVKMAASVCEYAITSPRLICDTHVILSHLRLHDDADSMIESEFDYGDYGMVILSPSYPPLRSVTCLDIIFEFYFVLFSIQGGSGSAYSTLIDP